MNEEQRPYIGVAVIVVRDGRVLLGKRRNTHGAGTWQFPGGHLEYGESIEDCARRELFEETGLSIVKLRMGPFTNDVFEDEKKHYVTLFVVAEQTTGDARVKEPDKCERWGWYRWSEMPQPHFLPIANLLSQGFTIADVPSPDAWQRKFQHSDKSQRKGEKRMNVPQPVSVHGGHSGQFCGHAKDTLEEIVLAYIDQRYPWVGITEHMPPVSDAFVYPEEKRAGFDAGTLKERFAGYMATCRRLQAKYADAIRIYVGFETEDCGGSRHYAKALIGTFSPDYVVGSVHHVNDIPFDYSKASYDEAADCCGGLDGLYAAYFDQQYEMIRTITPRVVGHLDIVRIYDPDYRSRLLKPMIWEKIVRNLKLIKALNLILDFNLRPLSRGENEPYLSAPILKKAADMGIDIVPGDDSHGVATIGAHMQHAITMLRAAGVSTQWREPVD